MLFVDNYNPKQAGGTGRIYIDMNAENRNTEPFKKDIDNPHLSGTNVVFSDGHTQHYPKTTVYGPEDSSFKSSKTGTRFWIPYN